MMTLTRLQSLQRQFIEDGFNDVRDSEVAQIVEMAIASCEMSEQILLLTEQRDAVVAENVALKSKGREMLDEAVAVYRKHNELIHEPWGDMVDYQTPSEFSEVLNKTPATDAAIAALRAEGFDSAFDEEPFGHIRRCGAFVIIEVNGDPHIKDGMPVFARQLRESKGEVSNG